MEAITVRLVVLSAALFCYPATTLAQSATPGWDVVVTIGSFSGHPEPQSGVSHQYDNWYQTGQFSVSAGRYLSSHLKTEIEFAATGEDSTQFSRYTNIPLSTTVFNYSAQRFYQTRTLAAALGWQFRENQWVHPYLMAGVAVDFERTRSHIREQFNYISTPSGAARVVIVPEQHEGPTTSSHPRGWVSGGAKFYASSRFFVRSELRVGFTVRVENVGVRIGLGVDF